MGNEIKDVLLAQTDLYARIAYAYENFKKVGAAKMTLGVAEARLQALEQCWAKFEARHEKLLPLRETLAEDDYIKSDVPALAYEAYLDQKGFFLDTIRALKARETTSTTGTASQDTGSLRPRTCLASTCRLSPVRF